MKNLLLFILLFFAGKSMAQSNCTPMNANCYTFKSILPSVKLGIPHTDTFAVDGVQYGYIVFRPADSLYYGWAGTHWAVMGADVAALVAKINTKVDSVIVTVDTLRYWINGVSYGQVLAGGSGTTVTSYGKNTGHDSTILLLSNGTRYAAKDSVGISFNPVAGTNITLTGSYPNITFNAGLTPANGPTNAVQLNGGSGIFAGSSAFVFNPLGNATVSNSGDYQYVIGGSYSVTAPGGYNVSTGANDFVISTHKFQVGASDNINMTVTAGKTIHIENNDDESQFYFNNDSSITLRAGGSKSVSIGNEISGASGLLLPGISSATTSVTGSVKALGIDASSNVVVIDGGGGSGTNYWTSVAGSLTNQAIGDFYINGHNTDSFVLAHYDSLGGYHQYSNDGSGSNLIHARYADGSSEDYGISAYGVAQTQSVDAQGQRVVSVTNVSGTFPVFSVDSNLNILTPVKTFNITGTDIGSVAATITAPSNTVQDILRLNSNDGTNLFAFGHPTNSNAYFRMQNQSSGNVVFDIESDSISDAVQFVMQDPNNGNRVLKASTNRSENSILELDDIDGNLNTLFKAQDSSGQLNPNITFTSSTFSAKGVSYAYTEQTGDYTYSLYDYTANFTTGTETATLPDPSLMIAGRVYVCKNSGLGVVTIDGNGTTIDGNTTVPVASGNAIQVQYTGSVWIILN